MNTTSDSHDVIRELVQGSKSTFRRHFPFVFTYMTMHHIIVMASYDRKVWSLHRALASASTHQILVFSRCSPFLVPKHQFSACFNYFHLSIHSFSSDDERACCQPKPPRLRGASCSASSRFARRPSHSVLATEPSSKVCLWKDVSVNRRIRESSANANRLGGARRKINKSLNLSLY